MRYSPLYLFLLTVFTFIGCEKEEPQPFIYAPYTAPCATVEKSLEIDSIIYGPSQHFPHALLRITFVDTTLEYGFNKVPETGLYQIVSPLGVGNLPYDNQIAFMNDSGSFKSYSMYVDSAVIYVDNYDSQLTVSHCELPYGGNYYFDSNLNVYNGNPGGARLFRMNY